MAPRHKNPSKRERTAVAPYNFVSVADPVIAFPNKEDSPRAVDHCVYHGNRLTGWIDVTLETKSPVYVRGSLTLAEYEQMEQQEKDDRTPHLKKLRNKPDFFHVGDPKNPVIPGSSLRGMLRTMAQIIGHGKLAPVSNIPLAYRAIADMSSQGEAYRQRLMLEGKKNYFTPRFEAGYIEQHNGRWGIRPAQKINDTTYARIPIRNIPPNLEKYLELSNAYKIYIEPGPYKFQPVRGGFLHICYAKVQRVLAYSAPGLIESTLTRSGKMFKKNTEAVVFPPDIEAQLIMIPDGSDEDDNRDLITAYRDQVSQEQRIILGRKDGILQNGQPVFYLVEDGKLVFFGHTQMFRMVYEHSPRHMLPAIHYDDNYTDLAEAIFGSVKGKETGQAGRVFVNDAKLLPEQKDIWLVGETGLIPEILSSPKPTTFQHYLTQSEPDLEKGKGLHTYNDSAQKSTLRGFKMYWHRGDVSPRHFTVKQPVDELKDTQHTKMRPVRSDIKFQFRVYYDNLLLDELGLLWWTLSLPVKGEHYHKLGMAKPLGLGSIKLRPRLTIVNPTERYTTLVDSDTNWDEAIMPKEVTEHYQEKAVKTFEKKVLSFLRQPDSMEFGQLERIQQLLEMLTWPGPQPPEEKTRYMQIEQQDPRDPRKKRNEYRERPVLPDPLHVDD